MENPEPRSQYLNAVLRQIERTAFRIPLFQREFVWGQRDILDLLESIENGYPIGSILTWRVEGSDDYFSGFRTSPFPEPDGSLAAYEVVLDGAQRLSSLYGCLRNPNSHPLYRVSYNPRTREFVYDQDSKEGSLLVPMGSLFDSRQFLFTKYGQEAKAVLDALLEKYEDDGLIDLGDARILQIPPIDRMGTPVELIRSFGSKAGFEQAVHELQETLYGAA